MKVLTLLLLAAALECAAQQHFVFVNRDRHRLNDTALLKNPALRGFQVKYVWRELEPSPGSYDFAAIRQDLGILAAHGKALFLQLQDVTFSPDFKNVPRYLLNDPAFHGGVGRQFETKGGKRVTAGWMARRWDPAVRDRFQKLLNALGAEFDGKIEGINLAETAFDVEETDELPEGFSFANYRDGILANMAALKAAFPKSKTMQYANFMPGEFLPGSDHGYLRSVYAAAHRLRVGVGGPDLLPYRRGQLNHAYPLITGSRGIVPTAVAVQEGNYSHTNPATKQELTVAELHRFARDVLHVDYLFWSLQEPYFSLRVLPYLSALARWK